jgi:hypothetical protein
VDFEADIESDLEFVKSPSGELRRENRPPHDDKATSEVNGNELPMLFVPLGILRKANMTDGENVDHTTPRPYNVRFEL